MPNRDAWRELKAWLRSAPLDRDRSVGAIPVAEALIGVSQPHPGNRVAVFPSDASVMMVPSNRAAYGEAGVGRSATETLREYLAGQALGAEEALRFIADDAVFDVGRGRFEGHREIRGFVERLRAVNSRTSVVEMREISATEVDGVFEQRDDDLGPLGIESIQLNVRVETTDDGRIKTFTARPTSSSIEALSAARAAGLNSEGMRLAEQAGTLPPDTGS